jgi:hypothetical protein
MVRLPGLSHSSFDPAIDALRTEGTRFAAKFAVAWCAMERPRANGYDNSRRAMNQRDVILVRFPHPSWLRGKRPAALP